MAEIKEMTPEELQQAIEENRAYTIIDVREDEEVREGMIPGAKHIRLGDIPMKVDTLNKDETHVVVCRSGRRSMNASEFMKEKGFEAINLKGGMLEWKGDTTKP
ncbi:hypothetical protein N781_07330 [Pontibacillus halophilus JSM 076056 = DSM 19796]|uniref:Rhodanese domain-containing protein n=1 Tax=Pontibacillus halophilus JSM 076056 = DSM 19796 TaxID=1385510 RepID=A0A0A5GE77_9BACI|nr:rhodanese-like domain-containing protein [Pontibacillus halophilus]KGX89498.1 hypothetical protein N781_07330 [Pontibacillus halophilus JSM 076056 = DSM 19796]